MRGGGALVLVRAVQTATGIEDTHGGGRVTRVSTVACSRCRVAAAAAVREHKVRRNSLRHLVQDYCQGVSMWRTATHAAARTNAEIVIRQNTPITVIIEESYCTRGTRVASGVIAQRVVGHM